jgi:hypothetical protein
MVMHIRRWTRGRPWVSIVDVARPFLASGILPVPGVARSLRLTVRRVVDLGRVHSAACR